MPASDHEHHGEVAGSYVQGAGTDREADDGDCERPHDVERRVAQSVRKVVVDDGDDDPDGVRRHREQQGVDPSKAESVDDRREEVLRRGRYENAVEHDGEGVEPPVRERLLEPNEPGYAVFVNVAGGVLIQTVFGYCSFFFRYPFRVGRKVG